MDDRRTELQWNLARLTEAIESGGHKGSEAASLIRERRLTVDALAALPVADGKVSLADQLAAKREARIAGADADSSASRRSQPRRSGRSNTAS